MQTLTFLLFFFFAQLGQAFSLKVDDSIDIFFPESLKHLQYAQTEFPVFWWNFLVIEPVDGEPNFKMAKELCSLLENQEKYRIKRRVCGNELGSFKATLEAWSDDLVFRERPEPLEKYRGQISSALSELSFLSSDQKEIFELKRRDPLDQWQIYLQKSQQMMPESFERIQGFLHDPQTERLAIPLQFSQAPKMIHVQELMQDLESYQGAEMVGAHNSAYTNEKQVHDDLAIVSFVGALVFGLFILFLVLKGRLAALLLFPPVALALSLAAWVTQLTYGSIHGLTLAFGSGIVGLAIDYGLHGAINSESKQTWKSNTVGFLTTLVGLSVLTMSGIPLIRQMMFFALLGIFFGFLLFYFLCRYLPKYFTIRSISMVLPDFKFSWIIILVLILGGIIGSFFVDLSFDLRRFNYQTAENASATNWFFSQAPSRETFLLVREKEALNKVRDEHLWAAKNGIGHAGLGEFLPPLSAQEMADAWRIKACPALRKTLSMGEQKIFSPFLENICKEERLAKFSFEDLKDKDYLNHFLGESRFVSVFYSQKDSDRERIREEFPDAKSLTESVQGFSKSLESDLKWMIPVAVVLSALVLFIYYKSSFLVLASLIPFMSGLGLFFLAKFLTGGGVDLISVLGLLMVFGFSIDYGVFVTDVYVHPQEKDDAEIVYSVIGLAAISNVIGFFPMIFAKHPVLHQLGFALFFGTIGTYLGTRWGMEKYLSLRFGGKP